MSPASFNTESDILNLLELGIFTSFQTSPYKPGKKNYSIIIDGCIQILLKVTPKSTMELSVVHAVLAKLLRAMALYENHPHPASALLPTPSGAANQLQKVASEHRG